MFENFGDEEIKVLVLKISAICLSEEFVNLRRELESIYTRNGLENPAFSAFQDALFALMNEYEDFRPISTRAH